MVSRCPSDHLRRILLASDGSLKTPLVILDMHCGGLLGIQTRSITLNKENKTQQYFQTKWRAAVGVQGKHIHLHFKLIQFSV
jgi:hypothetical protein